MNKYTIYAKNGVEVRVRHIQSGDAPYFVEIFEQMSSESRYRRFLQSLDDPSPTRVWQEAERIAQMDPALQDGLIAFADWPDLPNTPVGAARYVVIEPGVAEAAISVRDDMQGLGIGTQLLRLLTEIAREAGVRKLVGTVQNENQAVWKVLERLPFPLKRTPQGTHSEMEVDLTTTKAELAQGTAVATK